MRTTWLQLSAGDSALTATDQIQVTVNAVGASQPGWLGAPIDGTQVTGIVPVTVGPGKTLTGGVLSYWAVWDEENPVVLNGNTTGSGTLANWDTTVLPNGSYWLKLVATDSLGITQTSTVLVRVTGEYKPGRVTTTIRDFVVPLAGIPVAIERTYDSLERGISGDFGYGWKLSIDAMRLAIGPAASTVTLTVGGQRRTFYFAAQPNALFQFFYTPAWVAESGLYGTLTTTGDNCGGLLVRIGNVFGCAIVKGCTCRLGMSTRTLAAQLHVQWRWQGGEHS